MPTGYGKSLIYQFLAFLQPQISIVISPTRSLIYDQIVNLKTHGLTEVPVLDKELKVIKFNAFFANLIYGTPDTIESENVFYMISFLIKEGLINSISIDECHQVSVWGHCFDADYFTLIHQIKNEFPQVQLLLFSATASQRIKEDLKYQLTPLSLQILQPCSLEREHIHYCFTQEQSFANIVSNIQELFVKSYETGNTFDLSNNEIPCLTLIICNDYSVLGKVFDGLCESDITFNQCKIYRGEKSIYNSFRLARTKILLTDDTNLAGINIPFLKNLIVIGLPPSKEWFYQECGRIGRNGEESQVLVYWEESDFTTILDNIDLGANRVDNEILNFSNTGFLDSYGMNHNDAILAKSLMNEIYRRVTVRADHEYGTVVGKMQKTERNKYDKALFLLYFCGIIEKWLFFEITTFRFYINMNIDNGVAYFKHLVTKKVKEQSSNESFLNEYL